MEVYMHKNIKSSFRVFKLEVISLVSFLMVISTLFINGVVIHVPTDFEISTSTPRLPNLENIEQIDFSSVDINNANSITGFMKSLVPAGLDANTIISELEIKQLTDSDAGGVFDGSSGKPTMYLNIRDSNTNAKMTIDERMENAVYIGHELVHYLRFLTESTMHGNMRSPILQDGSSADGGYGAEYFDGKGYGTNKDTEYNRWELSEFHAYAWGASAIARLASQYFLKNPAGAPLPITKSGFLSVQALNYQMGTDVNEFIDRAIDNKALPQSVSASKNYSHFKAGEIDYKISHAKLNIGVVTIEMPNPKNPAQKMSIKANRVVNYDNDGINSTAEINNVVNMMKADLEITKTQLTEINNKLDVFNNFKLAYGLGVDLKSDSLAIEGYNSPEFYNKIHNISTWSYTHSGNNQAHLKLKDEITVGDAVGLKSQMFVKSIEIARRAENHENIKAQTEDYKRDLELLNELSSKAGDKGLAGVVYPPNDTQKAIILNPTASASEYATASGISTDSLNYLSNSLYSSTAASNFAQSAFVANPTMANTTYMTLMPSGGVPMVLEVGNNNLAAAPGATGMQWSTSYSRTDGDPIHSVSIYYPGDVVIEGYSYHGEVFTSTWISGGVHQSGSISLNGGLGIDIHTANSFGGGSIYNSSTTLYPGGSSLTFTGGLQ